MYKCCPNCGYEWQTWQDLLVDPAVVLVGYQVNFTRLETGIILFNHSCTGTIAYTKRTSDLVRQSVNVPMCEISFIKSANGPNTR